MRAIAFIGGAYLIATDAAPLVGIALVVLACVGGLRV